VARGEFKLPAPAPKVARFIFAALQGALLVKRTTDDTSQLSDVISVMKLQLAPRP
jgi:TetR/AcrR family transcriptional repressor of nem operon